MTEVLSQEAIAASLLSFWKSRFDGSVTTIYPGMKVDTTSLSEWVEIWVDSWSRRPQRLGGIPYLDVTATVHCFVKSGQESGRIQAITDSVRTVFAQESIPLKDYSESAVPTIGLIRLKEPETRNLTRHQTGSLQIVLHHTAVIVRGAAQAETALN
ncbi:MAG: hypothetical protein HUJ26_08185 [Planctomycetaceae bacterium]|nr:hypothetical protein [Planctomycetaceae bacterium]